SRDLRGYSLAALLSLVATLVLVNSLSAQGRGTGRGARVGYALLLGLAIATHVFAIVVLAIHIVWIAMRRSRADITRLAPAWIAAFAPAAAANANIEIMEFVQHGFPPSLFNPAFPLYLVVFLLGAPAVLPL